MKRKIIVLTMCIAIALLALLAVQQSTQAQRPGGGRPGGDRPGRPGGGGGGRFRMPLALEESWAQISFELEGVTGEILSNARKAYQQAWKERKELVKKMQDAGGDREVMRSVMSDSQKIESDLNKKLQDILTLEQIEKLAEWKKQAQQRSQRPPGMPPGRPGQGRSRQGGR